MHLETVLLNVLNRDFERKLNRPSKFEFYNFALSRRLVSSRLLDHGITVDFV